METQNTKEKMTYDSRMQVASEFTSKMSVMFQPHVRLRDETAGGMYLKEICEAINSRMPSEIPNHEVYREACREVWKGVVAKHRSSYWFSLADVISATNKVSAKYQGMYGDKKKKVSYQHEASDQESRPRGEGWTLEGAIKQLKMTDEMIARGELGAFGSTLRKIPLKAIERLGGDSNIPLPARKAVPVEHLPDENGNINMDLIKAGHQPPRFTENEDLDRLFDLGGDPIPDFGNL